VFVDDNDPALIKYPALRDRPQYTESSDAIFVPKEALSSTAVLAAILVHEGVRRRDAHDDNHINVARSLFPNTPAQDAADLWTEVNAFEIEGKLVEGLLGQSFADYLQEETDLADSTAVKNQKTNKGLLINPGVDGFAIEKALDDLVGFTKPEAKEFCLSILALAIPLHVGFKTINQIFDRNPNAPEELRAEFKASLVGASSEYLY